MLECWIARRVIRCTMLNPCLLTLLNNITWHSLFNKHYTTSIASAFMVNKISYVCRQQLQAVLCNISSSINTHSGLTFILRSTLRFTASWQNSVCEPVERVAKLKYSPQQQQEHSAPCVAMVTDGWGEIEVHRGVCWMSLNGQCALADLRKYQSVVHHVFAL